MPPFIPPNNPPLRPLLLTTRSAAGQGQQGGAAFYNGVPQSVSYLCGAVNLFVPFMPIHIFR